MKIKIVFLLIIVLTSFSFSQKIAITFDDAPWRDGEYFTGIERTETLIRKLDSLNVTAAFFCVTSRADSLGDIRLKSYADAGHIIANHTHTHPQIRNIGTEGYIKDFLIADSLLSEYKTYRKWFRYPYLNEGRTLEVRDDLRKALEKNNYINGYVTVDNYDWHLERRFQEALKERKEIDFEKLKAFYLTHIGESIKFYDELARKHLNRSPAHVLLLHENDLSALFIDDLIMMLRSNGWEIISPEEAYKDPIATKIPDVLFNNQGRVAALIHETGIEKSELVQETEDTGYLDEQMTYMKIFK